MPYKDRNDPRQKAAVRKYYEAHKAEYLARNLANKAAIRAWIHEQKDRACMDCGKRYPHYVMDFDHRPDEVKLYQPGRLWVMQSWRKAKHEIAKCDVVCANCHRERTHQRLVAADGEFSVEETAPPSWGRTAATNENGQDRNSLARSAVSA